MKLLVKTMAALQQEDKILEQFYTTLANRKNTAVAIPIPLNLDPNTTNTTSNDQELNYKMAAHDLISPLATQSTILDIVKEDVREILQYIDSVAVSNSESLKRSSAILDNAREEVRQVLQYIDSLSTSNSESIRRSRAALGRQEEVAQPIPFKQLIEDVIQLLGIRELHKHIDIVVRYNIKRAFYNNMAIIQSIVQNLIQNAVKYSKPNQKNIITIKVNDTSNGVEIIVQDTGIGMEKQRVDQLFNQVVDEHKGVSHSHGFGLYGVAQYVEKLNGKITVESTLHIGSTFTVSLPTLNSN